MFAQILNSEQEQTLSQYLKDSDFYFGLTPKEGRQLAYTCMKWKNAGKVISK